jgi:hypothetical protein
MRAQTLHFILSGVRLVLVIVLVVLSGVLLGVVLLDVPLLPGPDGRRVRSPLNHDLRLLWDVMPCVIVPLMLSAGMLLAIVGRALQRLETEL